MQESIKTYKWNEDGSVRAIQYDYEKLRKIEEEEFISELYLENWNDISKQEDIVEPENQKDDILDLTYLVTKWRNKPYNSFYQDLTKILDEYYCLSEKPTLVIKEKVRDLYLNTVILDIYMLKNKSNQTIYPFEPLSEQGYEYVIDYRPIKFGSDPFRSSKYEMFLQGVKEWMKH